MYMQEDKHHKYLLDSLSPLHTTSLGSGSHSPFSIHIDVLGPVSTSPEEQLKMMLSPSSATLA